MKTGSLSAFCTLLAALAAALALTAEARAQSEAYPSPRSMASLIAEGYETQTVQVFKDKIWMRKEKLEGIAYICDRGRIGSPAFEAYRKKEYEQISCTLAQ